MEITLGNNGENAWLQGIMEHTFAYREEWRSFLLVGNNGILGSVSDSHWNVPRQGACPLLEKQGY